MSTFTRSFLQYTAAIAVPFPQGEPLTARVRYDRTEDYPVVIELPTSDAEVCDALLERLCTVGGNPASEVGTGDTSPDTLTLFLVAVEDPQDEAHRAVCRDARERLASRSEELSGVVAEVCELRDALTEREADVDRQRDELALVREDVRRVSLARTALVKDCEKATDELRHLRADLEARDASCARLQADCDTLRAELTEFRAGDNRSVAELSRVIEAQKADLVRYETESAAQTEALDALRVRLVTAEEAVSRTTNADEAVAVGIQRFKVAELQRAQAQKDLADVQGILSADRLKHAEELKVAAAEATRLRDQLRGAGVALQSAADTAAEKVAAEREARTLAEDTVAALRRELADTIAARAVAESDLVRTVKERDDLTTAMQDRLRAAELDLRDAARFDTAPPSVAEDAPPRGPNLTVLHDPTDDEESARLARHAALSTGEVRSPGGVVCEDSHGGAPVINPLSPPVETSEAAQESPLTPAAAVPGVTLHGLPDEVSAATKATLTGLRYFKDTVGVLMQERPTWTRLDLIAWILRHREEYAVLRRLPADMVQGRVENLAESYNIR